MTRTIEMFRIGISALNRYCDRVFHLIGLVPFQQHVLMYLNWSD